MYTPLTAIPSKRHCRCARGAGGTVALVAGDIQAGGYYLMTYDGTNWDLH